MLEPSIVVSPFAAKSTDEVRLGVNLHTELLAHAVLNHLHELVHFARRSSAAIDHGERMLRRESDVSVHESLVEAGVLDEPGGGKLHRAVLRGERRRTLGLLPEALERIR